MEKRRTFLPLVLALVLCLSLAACGAAGGGAPPHVRCARCAGRARPDIRKAPAAARGPLFVPRFGAGHARSPHAVRDGAHGLPG